MAAVPLCMRRRREGFVMAAFLGVAGAAVADSLGLSGSTPNAGTFALNVAVVVLAAMMVVGSASWLRAVAHARPPALLI